LNQGVHPKAISLCRSREQQKGASRRLEFELCAWFTRAALSTSGRAKRNFL
jgi:hypothetical protein